MSNYKRIATEEAFTTQEILDRYRALLREPGVDTGFASLWGHFSKNAPVVGRLLDLGEQRIADMDAAGIAMQVLSLTAPGEASHNALRPAPQARSRARPGTRVCAVLERSGVGHSSAGCKR